MDSPVITSVDAIDDVAALISAIDQEKHDSHAVARLVNIAHAKIEEILGQQAHKVYAPDEEPLLTEGAS